MPQSMHSSKKRARLCDKTSGKCGEITFCLQVGTRVYALNCLFCSQICIQWDAFINHMEEEHVQELRSDHLLQQEIEEVNVDANNSKETAPKQSSAHMLEELPQSSQMCIRTELNNGASTQPILDYNDPLGGNSATKCASITATVKTEDYHFVPDLSYECRVDAAASDQTCDSINEQSHYCTMPFNNANILGSEERCANHNSIPDIHHMMANNLRTVEDTNKELKELKEDFSQFKYESEKMHSRLLTEIQLLQNQGSIRPKVCGILPNKPMETGDDFNKFEKTIQESSQKAMELKTFDSVLSFSETESELEATDNKSTPIMKSIYCVGGANFINMARDNSIFSRSFLQQIPSTQDIKRIPELENLLKIDVLENKHRTQLAKGLIGFILNEQPDRKIINEEFLQLAQSIVEIFPSEVKETYYVPYKKGRLAKGKLRDAYNNTRTRLSIAGLIRRRVKSKPEYISLGNGNSCENDSTEEDIDESELSTLKSESSDWDLVLATWKKTHYFRQRELKNQNLKPHEYIEKYKVILHEKNYELFDIDFKILYPTAKSFYEWKLYYRKIIAKAEKLKDKCVKEILTYINETEEEDSKLALSLMLIPYILPNPRQRTKFEIQECFISYCENIIDAEDETINRTNRIKLESQPKVYLVGDYNKTVCEAFVDICGTRLKFENPVKAIEVCFRCFMVMNIKYPRYCTHVWIFIQKLIYEVNTPRDAVIPAINTLINDLRHDKF